MYFNPPAWKPSNNPFAYVCLYNYHAKEPYTKETLQRHPYVCFHCEKVNALLIYVYLKSALYICTKNISLSFCFNFKVMFQIA
jgi:hypothetical protein